MAKKPELTLSPDDFELDEQGNVRIKTREKAQKLLEVLEGLKKPARAKTTGAGPKVKVEI